MPCARETSLWHNSLLYDAGLDVFHGSVELIEKSFFFFCHVIEVLANFLQAGSDDFAIEHLFLGVWDSDVD